MTRSHGLGERALPGLVSLSLLLVALIHLMPLLGVLGPTRLALLYGLDFNDPNLAILMRHRAVLFGLLGTYFACAAFRRPLQAGLARGCHQCGFVPGPGLVNGRLQRSRRPGRRGRPRRTGGLVDRRPGPARRSQATLKGE